jgi:FHA domain
MSVELAQKVEPKVEPKVGQRNVLETPLSDKFNFLIKNLIASNSQNGEISIGRNPESNLVISKAGISGQHCKIIKKNGQLFLEVLPTVTNQHLVKIDVVSATPGNKILLQSGDKITIDKEILTIPNINPQINSQNIEKTEISNHPDIKKNEFQQLGNNLSYQLPFLLTQMTKTGNAIKLIKDAKGKIYLTTDQLKPTDISIFAIIKSLNGFIISPRNDNELNIIDQNLIDQNLTKAQNYPLKGEEKVSFSIEGQKIELQIPPELSPLSNFENCIRQITEKKFNNDQRENGNRLTRNNNLLECDFDQGLVSVVLPSNQQKNMLNFHCYSNKGEIQNYQLTEADFPDFILRNRKLFEELQKSSNEPQVALSKETLINYAPNNNLEKENPRGISPGQKFNLPSGQSGTLKKLENGLFYFEETNAKQKVGINRTLTAEEFLQNNLEILPANWQISVMSSTGQMENYTFKNYNPLTQEFLLVQTFGYNQLEKKLPTDKIRELLKNNLNPFSSEEFVLQNPNLIANSEAEWTYPKYRDVKIISVGRKESDPEKQIISLEF